MLRATLFCALAAAVLLTARPAGATDTSPRDTPDAATTGESTPRKPDAERRSRASEPGDTFRGKVLGQGSVCDAIAPPCPRGCRAAGASCVPE
jgi:hypothetical protein